MKVFTFPKMSRESQIREIFYVNEYNRPIFITTSWGWFWQVAVGSLHLVSSNKMFSCGYKLMDGHDDVIKWKHFLRYWPFVRGIYRSLVNSPHRGQWRGALMLVRLDLFNDDTRPSGHISSPRWSFDVFFDLRLIKRLSKHSRGWWFEMLLRPLWCYCNVYPWWQICRICVWD